MFFPAASNTQPFFNDKDPSSSSADDRDRPTLTDLLSRVIGEDDTQAPNRETAEDGICLELGLGRGEAPKKGERKRERAESRGGDLLTELTLGRGTQGTAESFGERDSPRVEVPPWTLKKVTTASDINGLCRLMLPKSSLEGCILSHWDGDRRASVLRGVGVAVVVYDMDTASEHELVLTRWRHGSGSYVLKRGWSKSFVRRRGLKVDDEIGLGWDEGRSRLNFTVLSRRRRDV